MRSRILPALALLVASGFLVNSFPIQQSSQSATGSTEQGLSEEQMKSFLLNAKVINSRHSKTGTGNSSRLTLSDGTLTHDASFQPIDETTTVKKFETGRTELNFRDSYHFNIAAYELAKLLGLGDMMPVTVERKWEGQSGSLSWWLTVKMDEAERIRQNIKVPDPDAWNRQIYKMRVFSQLVYDTDRNLTNVLIGEDWKLYMIDFSRAFRLNYDLQNAKDLAKCDRQLFEKIRGLSEAEVEQKTKGHLNKSEIKALMKRRDKIVAYFQQLVDRQGESAVLY